MGIKQCYNNLLEHLLEHFAKKHLEGSEVEGEIQDITEFGLLVRLPDGLEGVFYQSDLSWDSNDTAIHSASSQSADCIQLFVLFFTCVGYNLRKSLPRHYLDAEGFAL